MTVIATSSPAVIDDNKPAAFDGLAAHSQDFDCGLAPVLGLPFYGLLLF